ncbi:helix-turn-helix domain-containing protein [Streptomyces sp. NPDC004596]
MADRLYLRRPSALDPDEAADVGAAYGEGAAVKALARRHQVAPKTIRRVLGAAGARELLEQLDPSAPGEQQATPAPSLDVVLDLPGLLADHLAAVDDETVRTALASGRTIRRGQGHSFRITAPLELHRTALQQAAALAAEAAERKAHRVYATRVTAATTAT